MLICCLLLCACAPQRPEPSPGHVQMKQAPKSDIPKPILGMPYLPPPAPVKPVELYTVVVDNVPVEELLFTVARDAGINVDLRPGITGRVTLNAVDQTLPQILKRVADQADLHYEYKNNDLIVVGPDVPFLRYYQVNYVNLSRESESKVDISTESITNVSSSEENKGSEKSSGATTNIINKSKHSFWETLEQNIDAILTPERKKKSVTKKNMKQSLLGQKETNVTTTKTEVVRNNIIVNAESGVISVRATQRQHEKIRDFLDLVLASVQRQVLIEATIVEVRLGEQYQAGVDWQRISGDFNYTQSMLDSGFKTPPFYSITYSNPSSVIGDIYANVRLLEQFGRVKVLSSPKVMALNNQAAILKVVDNKVYFNVEAKLEGTITSLVSGGTQRLYKTTTTPKVQQVGLIMSVIPQIDENDVVILNVRPTISRIIGFVDDPNPDLAAVGMRNPIPEVQMREIETVLRINSGSVAVIGGLMEDTTEKKTTGVPGLSRLPLVGDLFSYRNDQYTKSELVIFLRPMVIKDASLRGDFRDFRAYLPAAEKNSRFPPTGLSINPEPLYNK
ncbi:MAG: type II and III secretion system protein [Gammaproteobacteria bacterium]|nr:type II and III secretion system protein [Gammaproteobacteria bacterium]